MTTPLETELNQVLDEWKKTQQALEEAQKGRLANLAPLALELYGEEPSRDSRLLEDAYKRRLAGNIRDRFNALVGLVQGTSQAQQVLGLTTSLLSTNEKDASTGIINTHTALEVMQGRFQEENTGYWRIARRISGATAKSLDVAKLQLQEEISTAQFTLALPADTRLSIDEAREHILASQEAVIRGYTAMTRVHMDAAKNDLAYLGARAVFQQSVDGSQAKTGTERASRNLHRANEFIFLGFSRDSQLLNLSQLPAFRTH